MNTKPLILVLNGPNLNLLGGREPDKYGHTTLKEIEERLTDLGRKRGVDIECFQSNHEGALIDRLHEARERAVAAIMNPGGFTHTSVALADAVAAVEIPVYEVHISNVHAREPFRRHSYISPVAAGVICGLGAFGYELALLAALHNIKA